jgi:hypothetical protein
MGTNKITLLNKVFTIAINNNSEDPILLFSTLQTDENLTDLNQLKQIANIPEIGKLMGWPLVITPLTKDLSPVFGVNDSPFSTVLVTPCIQEHIAPLMESLPEDFLIILKQNNNSDPLVISPKQIYNNCFAPERLIIGCSDCFEEGGATCSLKNYAKEMHFIETSEWLDASDIRQHFKSQKSKLGEFTYIGPALTSIDSKYLPFTPGLRSVQEHDFSVVVKNSNCRSAAAEEGGRIKHFRLTNCSKCFVNKYCNASKYCRNSYPPEDQIASQILNNVEIPFTNQELRYLLYFSGTPIKLGQKTYFLTFKMIMNKLQYILRRRTNPKEWEMITFKEFKKLINPEYPQVKIPKTLKITSKLKALLCCLASRDYSPRFRNGWRATAYPTGRIKLRSFDTLEQVYWSWGRKAELPWSVQVTNLEEFFKNWGTIPFNEKEY